MVRNQEREVVITGCGLLTPLGDSGDEVFAAALQRRSATGLEAGFATERFTSRVVGTLPAEVDLTRGMRKDQVRYFRKNSKVMARDIQIAVGSAGPAIEDAGLPVGETRKDPVLPTIDHTRFGIIYGAGFIPCDLDGLAAATSVSIDDDGDISLAKWGREGMPLMYPLWLLKYLPNMLSCHTGIIWDCQGPSNSVTCNDTGGLLAIGEAFRHVARGTADIMLTGAGESRINPTSMLRHVLLAKATVKGNDRPSAAQRPFDVDRDGYVCAEGGGTLVIESAEHAADRGRSPRAVVAGFGSSCATSLPNVSELSGRGIALAIKAALRDAGLEGDDIDAVVARGAAVPEEDVAEATAIRKMLGGDVPVTSFSGGMGNVGAAQGPVGAAMAVEMMDRGCVPPICNCDDLDPACPINAVTDGPLEKPLSTVIVLSSTVGGQTAALIVRKV
ncbi:MAG: beta-ketoacyl-[acyl-carrier-protein] synthase family protein [Anaerolineaceae bacterium]|nr:beta-ketoacyl-[acyl-carrier-protein] synthase family protein [Anaerolineaceae bacterium]